LRQRRDYEGDDKIFRKKQTEGEILIGCPFRQTIQWYTGGEGVRLAAAAEISQLSDR
jgi:hypothetical protein